jgi:hypothetical protein
VLDAAFTLFLQGCSHICVANVTPINLVYLHVSFCLSIFEASVFFQVCLKMLMVDGAVVWERWLERFK